MKVMIMAGGTGGHVFPALAVAEQLRLQGHEVRWMGAPNSFEASKVPAAGIAMDYVQITGLRGKGALALFAAPIRLLKAVAQAFAILRREQPNVVLGMGGFVAGPGGLAARLCGKALVIHEQNAAAGLTNRLLAKIAHTVLQAFPHTFARGLTVGNPVRAGFAELAEPTVRISPLNPARVLVVGGSQGAKALNQIVPAALALLPASERPNLRHQAGRTLDVATASFAQAGVADCAQVEAFITDMPAAYAAADLVICRSGASTIAELSAAGCASILVPFPYAVDDHQTANARYLADAGAAVLITEKDLTPARLATEIKTLLGDRERLVAMANAARGKAWRDATTAIVEALLNASRPTSHVPRQAA